MSQFISVPSKKGYETKFIDPISAYVKEFYGEEQRNSHANAFTEFNNMRSKMLNKLGDKHESTIGVLTRYLDQLVALESKIPIEENGVRIDFKWDDAFAKDAIFGKKGSLKIASGAYERVCVLFNIAAIQSQVAETSNLSDDGGLKTAARYYQQAAGIFTYLKSDVPNVVSREPTVDLNGDTLSTLNILMLAQAQELIYTKAVRDSHKDGNIAKIIQQTSDLYADAMKLMQLNSVKSIWPKEWVPIVAGKQAGYHAMAEYYQARACGSNQSFGEQIARFRKALDLMKTASTRAGTKFAFRSEQEKIKKELEVVEKENNVIYHDAIPDVSSLSPVPKAVVAKEIPIENPMNKDFRDLFDKIVPLAVNSAMNMFQNKRNAMLNAEIYRLKEATNTLSGIMASLNLPAALDDTAGDQVPADLLSKAASVRKDGGVDKIEELLNGLPDVLSRNLDILNESIRLVDDEEKSDNQLREQFKERWNRTPSNKLTEGWRSEITKFSSLLNQAKGSDEVVRTNYKQYSSQIRILSLNETAFKENIPKSSFSSNNGSDQNNSVKNSLRKLCSGVEELKKNRANLCQEITNIEMNNVGNLLNKALQEDPGLDQDRFAEDLLNSNLSSYREKVRQSLNLQEELVTQLQEKSSQSVSSGVAGESRAAVISSLVLAYDKFYELKSNLEEGLKFYADLTEILLKFQSKVEDFCFARKTEKDELMKDLQASILKEKTEMKPPRSNTIQATSGGTLPSQPLPTQQQQPPIEVPQRPPPTYQGVAAGGTSAPISTEVPSAPPGQPQPQPMGIPYPPNPYGGMPQPYMPGVVHPYPYPNAAPMQPPQPGQMPHYPGGYYPGYPTGYNPYPTGYNPYFPPR